MESSNLQQKVQLVFLGSPLVDITAKCSPAVLEEYGMKPDDCTKARQEHDALFKTLFDSSDSHIGAGGSALNSARIAKWILGEKGIVSFSGCVGNDDFAKWIANELLSEDVQPLFAFHDKEPTGICACLLVSSKERSMCTRHGAAAQFVAEHLLNENIQRHLLKADCILVVGYFLAHSPDVVYKLAEICSPSQIFSLSLSAEYICRDHAESLLNVLPRVDVLLGNEVEVMTFALALGATSRHSVADAVKLIAGHRRPSQAPPRIVIVSRGSDPVIVAEGGQRIMNFHVPENITVVDSVGCGDALAGGFLAEYITTRNVPKAIRMGIQAAVTVAQVDGCDPPLHQTCKPDESITMKDLTED